LGRNLDYEFLLQEREQISVRKKTKEGEILEPKHGSE